MKTPLLKYKLRQIIQGKGQRRSFDYDPNLSERVETMSRFNLVNTEKGRELMKALIQSDDEIKVTGFEIYNNTGIWDGFTKRRYVGSVSMSEDLEWYRLVIEGLVSYIELGTKELLPQDQLQILYALNEEAVHLEMKIIRALERKMVSHESGTKEDESSLTTDDRNAYSEFVRRKELYYYLTGDI